MDDTDFYSVPCVPSDEVPDLCLTHTRPLTECLAKTAEGLAGLQKAAQELLDATTEFVPTAWRAYDEVEADRWAKVRKHIEPLRIALAGSRSYSDD